LGVALALGLGVALGAALGLGLGVGTTVNLGVATGLGRDVVTGSSFGLFCQGKVPASLLLVNDVLYPPASAFAIASF